MRNQHRSVIALLALGLAIPLLAQEFKPEEGFVLLFNGKDLTGWRHRTVSTTQPAVDGPALDGKTDAGDGRYTVKDGVLVGNTAAGRQLLWTTQSYAGNYVLRFEFRAAANTDGGMFMNRTQIQCGDYSSYAFRNFRGYKPLDWNTMEVTVTDGVARCTCNGEVLVESLRVPEPGPIGFEADRGGIEYRRMRIKTN
jgi:hypothetical protein